MFGQKRSILEGALVAFFAAEWLRTIQKPKNIKNNVSAKTEQLRFLPDIFFDKCILMRKEIYWKVCWYQLLPLNGLERSKMQKIIKNDISAKKIQFCMRFFLF